jgi:hypothetical protein
MTGQYRETWISIHMAGVGLEFAFSLFGKFTIMFALKFLFPPESAIAITFKARVFHPVLIGFIFIKLYFKCGIGIKYNMYTTFSALNNATVLQRYHKNRIQVGICGLKPPHNWL